MKTIRIFKADDSNIRFYFVAMLVDVTTSPWVVVVATFLLWGLLFLRSATSQYCSIMIFIKLNNII